MKHLETDKIYSCENHIDIAIDDFLVKNETFPILNSSKDRKCDYCDGDAVYVLSRSKTE